MYIVHATFSRRCPYRFAYWWGRAKYEEKEGMRKRGAREWAMMSFGNGKRFLFALSVLRHIAMDSFWLIQLFRSSKMIGIQWCHPFFTTITQYYSSEFAQQDIDPRWRRSMQPTPQTCINTKFPLHDDDRSSRHVSHTDNSRSAKQFTIHFFFCIFYIAIGSFHTRCRPRDRCVGCWTEPVDLCCCCILFMCVFLRFNSYTNWKSSQSPSFSAKQFSSVVMPGGWLHEVGFNRRFLSLDFLLKTLRSAEHIRSVDSWKCFIVKSIFGGKSIFHRSDRFNSDCGFNKTTATDHITCFYINKDLIIHE